MNISHTTSGGIIWNRMQDSREWNRKSTAEFARTGPMASSSGITIPVQYLFLQLEIRYKNPLLSYVLCWLDYFSMRGIRAQVLILLETSCRCWVSIHSSGCKEAIFPQYIILFAFMFTLVKVTRGPTGGRRYHTLAFHLSFTQMTKISTSQWLLDVSTAKQNFVLNTFIRSLL